MERKVEAKNLNRDRERGKRRAQTGGKPEKKKEGT